MPGSRQATGEDLPGSKDHASVNLGLMIGDLLADFDDLLRSGHGKS